MFEALDPYVRTWEEFWKIPAGKTSSVWLPEGIGRVIEALSDVTIEPTGSKIFKTVLGVVLGVAPQRIPGIPDRAVAELQQMATHLGTEFVDPTPQDLVRIANSISELRAGITFGDWSRIARAFGLKTPEQITAEAKAVVDAFSRALGFAAPAAVPPPAAPAPPTPTVFPTVAPIEVPGFG